MSFPDPPLREKDFKHPSWSRWFQQVQKIRQEAIDAIPDAIGGGTGITVTDNGDGSVTITIKRQNHEADASASHNITDPADSPATADALRDDLVANTMPSIETALNALGAKVNAILLKLETAEVLRSS